MPGKLTGKVRAPSGEAAVRAVLMELEAAEEGTSFQIALARSSTRPRGHPGHLAIVLQVNGVAAALSLQEADRFAIICLALGAGGPDARPFYFEASDMILSLIAHLRTYGPDAH